MDNKEIRAQLKSYLKFMKASGIDVVARWDDEAAASAVPAPSAPPDETKDLHCIKDRANAQQRLKAIRKELGDCQRCGLAATRTKLVFGSGNPCAELLFVGEAPGRDEDQQGEPFVGKAGQLLTRIIEAMGLRRDDVYICNIIKCRPPENRNPKPEEIASCQPFLLKQIEAVKPKIICALGTFAAQTLLETGSPISALRGRFHKYHDIPLMPTYHPAYLLRNPGMKRQVWEDVQKIQKALNKP